MSIDEVDLKTKPLDEQDAAVASALEAEKTPEQALAEMKQALEASVEKQKEAEKQIEDARLRGLAEAENARRRAQIDIENARKYSIERLAKELLAVIDSLEQALSVPSQDKPLQEGVQLTLKLFLDTLDKFGIEEINPEGAAFNPLKHEAISMQAASSPEEANRVLMVAQKGFTLKERILRPARVVVSQWTGTPEPDASKAE